MNPWHRNPQPLCPTKADWQANLRSSRHDLTLPYLTKVPSLRMALHP
jgi:hypothetical protein